MLGTHEQLPVPNVAVDAHHVCLCRFPSNAFGVRRPGRPTSGRSHEYVPPHFESAAVATPRTDDNSMLAHQQFIAKAKAGGIDLYFVGDSITRRWGTSDDEYREMLANWNENFFGWNAANFGWGGDTTQNILWRLAKRRIGWRRSEGHRDIGGHQ